MSTYDSIPSSQVAASLGSGVGVAEVISWQVSRALSGGGLPQQARAASGSSVGSGSVTLVPDTPGESPWSVNATVPGEAVSIDAAADVGAPLSPVARMVSRDVSADGWLSPVRTLSVEDEAPRGQVAIPEFPRSLDASAAIDWAARAAGFSATPPPPPGTVFSLPLVGSSRHEVGAPPQYAAFPPSSHEYVTVDGTAMYAGILGDAADDAPYDTPTLAAQGVAGATFGLAYTLAILAPRVSMGTEPIIQMILRSDDVARWSFWTQRVDEGLRLRVYWPGVPTADAPSLPLPAWVELGHPHRYIVTWEASSATTWSGRLRAYVDGHEITPPQGLSMVTSEVRGEGVRAARPTIHTPPPGQATRAAVGGILVAPSLSPADYGVLSSSGVTAKVASANSPLGALAEPTAGSAWDVIQQVAAATLGACWIDEEGRLIYRNRDQLRGDVPQYTIDALDHLEDVPWSISTDEVADRIEFTYRPAVVAVNSSETLTVLEVADTVRVAAGATVTLMYDLAGSATGLSRWYPMEAGAPEYYSRYAAWTAPPGEAGSAPPGLGSALDVSSEMVGSSRIRIRIRNTTAAPLWVYQLTVRARVYVQPGADITIARGLPETTAQRPLQINAGSWVQDDTTAHQIADWLESQSAMPLPTIPPVRVIPDASRRLGDVVRVRIESIGDHEAVVFKALITSIDNSQSAGTYEQRLGLTILAVTFDDWMRWGQAKGITTFNGLQSALAHLTTFDALDHWLTDLGGDL